MYEVHQRRREVSQNPARQLSQKKKILSAIERVEMLENTLPTVVAEVNKALTNIDKSLARFQVILDALVEVVGPQQVQAAVDIANAKKEAERAEAAKQALEIAVKEGRLKAVTEVAPNTILVGKEVDKEGNQVGSRVQLSFKSIKPEFRDTLLGKSAGAVIDLPDGKFEVQEVYELVEPPVSTYAADAVEPKQE